MNFPLARHLAWLIWRVTCLSNPITYHKHSQSHSHSYSHSHSHKCECVCAWVSPQICACYQFVIQWLRLKLRRGAPGYSWGGGDLGVERGIGLQGMLIAHCNCKWHDRGNLWTWLWFCFGFRRSFSLVMIIIYPTLLCENWPFFIASPHPLPAACHSKTRFGRRLYWFSFLTDDCQPLK